MLKPIEFTKKEMFKHWTHLDSKRSLVSTSSDAILYAARVVVLQLLFSNKRYALSMEKILRLLLRPC